MDIHTIITELKQGHTVSELARKYHVNNEQIATIKRGLKIPTAKVISKILSYPDFKEFFINAYMNSSSNEELIAIVSKHPVLSRIRKPGIQQRISEIRNYFDLPPRLHEETYTSESDRIKGYMLRNTRYTAKRRGIPCSLHYSDFEIPKYCPILGVPLTYMGESDGNNPYHATIDRIDNSKGYEKGNVIVISRLANAMKNSASFDLILKFCYNMPKLIKHYKEQGTLGSITDIFSFEPKLSLDS